MDYEEREKLEDINNYAQAISVNTFNINENMQHLVLDNGRRYEAYMNGLGKIFLGVCINAILLALILWRVW